ncbi:MAG: hypothetical protein QF752_03615 [Planctomycetota bacterium]|nr:hypothetical protein [Planctomycetota bacterium]
MTSQSRITTQTFETIDLKFNATPRSRYARRRSDVPLEATLNPHVLFVGNRGTGVGVRWSWKVEEGEA